MRLALDCAFVMLSIVCICVFVIVCTCTVQYMLMYGYRYVVCVRAEHQAEDDPGGRPADQPAHVRNHQARGE